MRARPRLPESTAGSADLRALSPAPLLRRRMLPSAIAGSTRSRRPTTRTGSASAPSRARLSSGRAGTIPKSRTSNRSSWSQRRPTADEEFLVRSAAIREVIDGCPVSRSSFPAFLRLHAILLPTLGFAFSRLLQVDFREAAQSRSSSKMASPWPVHRLANEQLSRCDVDESSTQVPQRSSECLAMLIEDFGRLPR